MPEKKVQPQSLDKGNQSRHLNHLFHFALIFNLTYGQIILKEGNAGILRIQGSPHTSICTPSLLHKILSGKFSASLSFSAEGFCFFLIQIRRQSEISSLLLEDFSERIWSNSVNLENIKHC